MGLVKTRRLAAMQKMQHAKAGMKPPPVKWNANSERGYDRKVQLPQRRTGL